jgi:hypothetical protein
VTFVEKFKGCPLERLRRLLLARICYRMAELIDSLMTDGGDGKGEEHGLLVTLVLLPLSSKVIAWKPRWRREDIINIYLRDTSKLSECNIYNDFI